MATLDMTERHEGEWKSPVRKLVRFFERSRNGWKDKYMSLKDKYKLQGNQVRAVEKSRDKWKEEAKVTKGQLSDLQRQLEELKQSTAAA